MTTYDERPVVVGVPDDDVEDALRFAAREARRAGCGLRLVHSEEAGLSSWGQAVLHRAVAVAAELAGPGTQVTGELVTGIPVEAVLASASAGREVVLRRRDVLHLIHTLTSEAATAIRVPVVCVPPHWTAPDGDQRPVTVGVEDVGRAEPLLRQAAALAADRRVPLQVLHVRTLPADVDPVIEERVGGEWDTGVRADLERALASCGPTVPVSIEIDHGTATESLLRAAEASQLLVLQRNAPAAHVGSRLGRAARSLLHECPAPLMVLPPAAEPHAAPQAATWGRAEAPSLV